MSYDIAERMDHIMDAMAAKEGYDDLDQEGRDKIHGALHQILIAIKGFEDACLEAYNGEHEPAGVMTANTSWIPMASMMLSSIPHMFLSQGPLTEVCDCETCARRRKMHTMSLVHDLAQFIASQVETDFMDMVKRARGETTSKGSVH